jgi:hypothetical protein
MKAELKYYLKRSNMVDKTVIRMQKHEIGYYRVRTCAGRAQ